MTAERKKELAIIGFLVTVLSFIGAVTGTWGTQKFWQGSVTADIVTLKADQVAIHADIARLDEKIVGDKRFEMHCQQNIKDVEMLDKHITELNNNVLNYIYEAQKKERASR